MLDNPGIVDPPHTDISFPIVTNAQRLHAELEKVFGERLLGLGVGPQGTVVYLVGVERDKNLQIIVRDEDRTAIESVLAKHDPTPSPAQPTQEEIIASLIERIEALEGKKGK